MVDRKSKLSGSPRKPLGWGIVGCGKTSIAEKRLIPGLARARGGRLIAVTDWKPENIQRSADKHGCTGHPTLQALLSDPRVDVIYIGSPVFLHAEQVRLAADAGKHILCEKPLALTFSACRGLHRHCERRGITLRVGFMMRFHPLHRRIWQLISAGKLGRIISVRAQLSHLRVEHNSDGSPNWRQDPLRSGGGSMMDMGIHCIDLLSFLIGLPIEDVSARIATLENTYAVEDTGALLVSFSGGAIGMIDSSFAIAGARQMLEIHGTRASILAENSISQLAEGSARWVAGPQVRLLQVADKLDPRYALYIREIEAMHAAIRSGNAHAATARDACLAQAVVETAYRSARSGRTLRIPDFDLP